MGRFYHGPVGYHLKNCSVYKLIIMIDALEEVNYRLRVQVRHQPTITAALIWTIQTEFNEICWQVFTSAITLQLL